MAKNNSIEKLIFLFFLIFNLSKNIIAKNTVEKLGDISQFLPVSAAIATTLIIKDYEGLKQLTYSTGTTFLSGLIIKTIVNEKRPMWQTNATNLIDRGKSSFPSSHTSFAFSGASFIHRRYGFKYAIPSYLISTFVAYSRIDAKKHYWWDTIAGAALAIGINYFFTNEYLKNTDILFNISENSFNFKITIYL